MKVFFKTFIQLFISIGIIATSASTNSIDNIFLFIKRKMLSIEFVDAEVAIMPIDIKSCINVLKKTFILI